ncbi:MAG: type VII secretion-associated protein [Mycobacterium sp.]
MDTRAVTAVVLVIGPGWVSGPNPVPEEKICAAIEAIDDEHVLVDEHPVRVDELWAAVIAEAAGNSVPGLVLVLPGWWCDARVSRIHRAAIPHCRQAEVRRRFEVYRSPVGCFLEIAPEFVLCRIAGRPVAATPRLGEMTVVAEAAAHTVTGSAPVLIDAPAGVAGAADLACAIADHLRRRGRETRIVDDTVLAGEVADHPRSDVRPPRHRTAWALSMGAVLALGALLGAARTVTPADTPTTLITEGRVTMQIPAGWAVQRITAGAGSARVQVFPPADGSSAILLTQSPAGPDLADTATMLRAALELEPPGVFTAFRDDDHRGGRAVVSYTEIRESREIDWSVFIDGPVRIAVGCQQPTPGADTIREHCDVAVRSAHASR